MNLVLTESKCKVCRTRLAEFEIKNNSSLCMDCYKEGKNDKEKLHIIRKNPPR